MSLFKPSGEISMLSSVSFEKLKFKVFSKAIQNAIPSLIELLVFSINYVNSVFLCFEGRSQGEKRIQASIRICMNNVEI